MQLGQVELDVLDHLLAHTDLVLAEQVEQPLAVNQGDRGGAALEGRLLGVAGEAAGGDDRAAHDAEAMQRAAQLSLN